MAIVNSVDDAFNYVKSILATAQKKADDTFPVIQKLHEIKPNNWIGNVSLQSAFTWKNYYNSNNPMTSVEQIDKKLEEYSTQLQQNIKDIEATHELNIPIIQNNKLVKEKVTFVMLQIGMPSTYCKTYYKTNRSRTPTTETTTAGWVQDLGSQVHVNDGYEAKISSAKSAFDSIKRQADLEKQRIRQEQQVKEKAEKNKKSVQALARLQLKYGLDEDSEWSDVLEALDKADKYFALARALEDQRGDWSEGFDRVQYAVDAFVVETEEDKEIFESLHELAYDEDLCDGRTFRDCEWNYSVLYGKVSEELLKDYETIREYYEKY